LETFRPRPPSGTGGRLSGSKFIFDILKTLADVVWGFLCNSVLWDIKLILFSLQKPSFPQSKSMMALTYFAWSE
jgi:hypothetical protein